MARLNEQALINVTRQALERYAGYSEDSKAYLLRDDEQHIYGINIIKNEPGPQHGLVMIQARILGDYVVIDQDMLWDKNLWQALEKAGIPREQIILAYKGEKLPSLDEAT